MRRALSTGLWALLAAGCASLGPPPRIAACPGPLRPTNEIAGDFTRQLRYRARAETVDEALSLVLQKRGDVLTLVAFLSFGAEAFALTQKGVEVEVKSSLGRGVAIPPENVLRDLHRALFLASAPAVTREGETYRIAPPGCGYQATLVALTPASRSVAPASP